MAACYNEDVQKSKKNQLQYQDHGKSYEERNGNHESLCSVGECTATSETYCNEDEQRKD